MAEGEAADVRRPTDAAAQVSIVVPPDPAPAIHTNGLSLRYISQERRGTHL